jgi:hypothetical protein
MRKHYVTFISPGTLFNETTIRPIDSWDPKAAVTMAEAILERYDATPYAFEFSTVLSAPAVVVEGVVLQVSEKVIAQSGRFFLGGTIQTYDEVDLRAAPDENILRSNMRCNGWWIVITNTNSFKSTQPFDWNDVVVDATGTITTRGDSPERMTYRVAMTAKHEVRS